MIRRFRAKPIPPSILKAGILIILMLLIAWVIYRLRTSSPPVTDFDSCVAAGNPVVETYPEQCLDGTRGYIRGR